MTRVLIYFVLAVVILCNASAQDAPDCANAMEQSTMNQCAYLDFQEADKELNAQWPQVKAEAEQRDRDAGITEHFKVLLESQRAWLAYRDAECKRAGHMALGGSMEPMLESGCKQSLTEDRIKALKQRMEQ